MTHDRLDYDGEGLSEAQVEGRSPLEVARDWVDAAVARQAERGDVPEPLAISIASVDADGARKVFKLIDALEDSDDVQNVYSNVDISDEVLAELEND